ncbi:MAG: ATP/GTP-binding protein [Methylococcales bacterium]
MITVLPENQDKNPSAPTSKTVATKNKTFATSNDIKLIIVGNVGSGKTTSINLISEIPVIGSEAAASEKDALHRKKTTTVAMEYGQMTMQQTKLHLYGTPGQRRFDFMASIICKGSSGMVVMIDNGCNDPLGELDYFLKLHADFLKKHPAILAITHCDDIRTTTSLIDYHIYAMENGFEIPVMRLDAREKSQVKAVILKLLIAIIRKKAVEKKSASQ